MCINLQVWKSKKPINGKAIFEPCDTKYWNYTTEINIVDKFINLKIK